MKVLAGSLKKYLRAYCIRLKIKAEYKLALFSLFLKPIIKILIISFLWMSIFSLTGKNEIAGMDISIFIHYVALAGFIKIATLPWHTSDEVLETIKSGNLTSYITKPIDYLKLQFSFIFAEVSVNGLYGIGIFLGASLIGSFFLDYIYFPEILTLILFLISLLIAVIISYFFYFIIACTAFWFGETWSVMGGIVMVQAFLSGEIIPLNISPMLLTISGFMPFQSMSFIPIFIYLGKFSFWESILNIGGQLFWLIIMFFLAKLILKKGIKQFESQGG